MNKHAFLITISMLVIVFLFLPLFLIMLTAFNSADFISLPIQRFSLKWFEKAFKSRSLMNAMAMSIKLALESAAIGVVIGLFASIALTRKQGKLSRFLLNTFLSSALIPGVVMGYVLFRFIVVKLAVPLDIALIVGHLLIVLPYSIRLISASLKECDTSIEEAARTLGCRPFKAFIMVVLPDLKGGIISAFMMGFINSFNNIPVSMYLKGPGKNTLPYAMMNYIEYSYEPTVSALSVVIMVMTLVFMLMINKLTGATASMKEAGN